MDEFTETLVCHKCRHPLCNPFSALHIGVMVLVQVGDSILLGRDRKKDNPEYTGHLGGCSGHIEPKDRGCHIACACRELKEEFKLDLTPQLFIDGIVHVEKFQGIPLYVYRNDSINVDALQRIVTRDCEALPVTSAYAEISELVLRDIKFFTTEKSKKYLIPITRNTVNAVFNTTMYMYERVHIYTAPPKVIPEKKPITVPQPIKWSAKKTKKLFL